MIWYYIRYVFNWILINRWWNYPRIIDINELEHLALQLHYIIIVYFYLKKELTYNFFIYFIWTSFFTFILSDINSFIKLKIQEKEPNSLKYLKEKIFEFLISLDNDWIFKDDIEIAFSYNPEKEILLAKNLAVKYEIKHNYNFFPYIYESSINYINSKINEYYIPLNPDIERFIANVYRLKFIYRWNRLPVKYKISVLSHTYIVFFIVYLLWKIKKYSHEKMIELFYRSLYHDIVESVIWDIVSPTKTFFDKIEEIEKEYAYSEFNYLPSHASLFEYMLNPFKEKDVKYADILSAMFEAFYQSDRIFYNIYKKIKRKLINIKDPAVDYILNFWAEYFNEDIDDLFHKYLWKY